MTAPSTRTAGQLNERLDWILEILQGGDDTTVVSVDGLPAGHVEIDRFTVYPSLRSPRLLISGGSNKVRSATLARVAGRAGTLGSLARKASAQAARVGADHVVLGPDVIISRPATVDSNARRLHTDLTLREHLEVAIDAEELCLAVTVGPLRPNRKPVVQLMNHSGQLVAYAKIGWDDPTRAMVDHEATALRSAPSVANLVIPKILHHESWAGLSVLVTAPVVHDGDATPPQSLVFDVSRNISHMTPVQTTALADSTWVSVQRSRAARLGASGSDIVEVLDRCVELHGHHQVAFGTSHGDWAPWNMRRMGHRLGVWDWERTRNDAPVGIDLVHYHFQVAFHGADQSVAEGIDAVRQTVPSLLTRLGVDGEQHDLIAVLYLIELALRFAESSISDDSALARTRSDLMVEIHHLMPRVGSTTEDRRIERHPATTKRGRVFTRRMLGGPGVPAPARNAVKRTAKTYGIATSSMRVLPNTYIVGAQRCGTTSLFRYLTQNRSVTGPTLEKGVHYFDTNFDKGSDWYRSHFPTARSVAAAMRKNGTEQRVIEASPYYLFHPMIPGRIHDLTPNARIIVLVRDPTERALSHHNHEVKRGFETLDFADALAAEPERLAGEVERLAVEPTYVSYEHQHHSYVSRGQYAEQIRRYDELFGTENVLLVRTQDLEVDPRATVDRVLQFLDVPVMGKISFPHYNARRYSSMAPDLEADLRRQFAASDQWVAERLGVDDPWA